MPSSPAFLNIRVPDEPPRTVALDKDEFLIGRRPDCDLVFPDGDISRVQAVIRRQGDIYLIEDGRSTFGTFVNGAPTGSRALRNRDTITMGRNGRIEMTFYHEDPMSRILTEVDSRSAVSRSADDYRNLELLLEICTGFNSMTSLQDLLELALDAIIDVTQADRGFLLMRDENGAMHPRAARKLTRERLESEGLRFSNSIVDEVIATGEPRFLTDTATDRRARGRSSIEELDLRSVTCVPLRQVPASRTTRSRPGSTSDGVLGVIYADCASASRPLSESDRELINSIAVQASLALENFHLRQEELERRLIERETEREIDRLRAVDRIKTEFLSNVSHELRTPLTALKGSIENMIDGLTGPLTAQQHRYLNRMNESAEQLNRLINDLLDLARIESGRLPLRERSTSMGRLLEDAVESMRPLADRRGVSLKVEPPSEDVVVVADRDRLMQVLFNLIGNSIKFTPSGGEISLACTSADQTVSVSVTDDGTGIEEGDLQRIFDRFYQSPGAEGVKTVGTGLGLPIARSLVELHGGRIWAEKRTQGSRFVFTLPLSRPAGDQPTAREAAR